MLPVKDQEDNSHAKIFLFSLGTAQGNCMMKTRKTN